MFGHKHDWHKIDEKARQETKPYGNQGFVKTIYYYMEGCASCPAQRKAIYNYWIHKLENEPDPNDKWAANKSTVMRMDGPFYEKA